MYREIVGKPFNLPTSNFDWTGASTPEREMLELEEPEDDPFEWTWERIEPLLSQMAPELADVLTLQIHDRITQEAIGRLFGISQAAISYRFKRAQRALRFIVVRRTICGEMSFQKIERDLSSVLTDVQCKFYWELWETTCLDASNKKHGWRDFEARKMYGQIVRILQRQPGLRKYLLFLQMLPQHWSILRLMPVFVPDHECVINPAKRVPRIRSVNQRKEKCKKM